MSRLERWEGRAVEEWRRGWGVPRLEIYDVVGSTNDVARGLAEEGAPGGTTVIADHQTRGRGQRGREWHAPPAVGLLLSMVLRPGRSHEEPVIGAVPLRVGLAVARALERVAPIRVQLKWPNDLLVDGRKLGGILCEGSLAGDRFALVVGIGINLGQREGDFPHGLEFPATSLAMYGAGAERAVVAGAVVGAIAALRADPAHALSAAELREFRKRDILRDCAIMLDGDPAGIARGVSADGALQVETAGGLLEIRSGTVRRVGGGRRGSSAAAPQPAGSPDTTP